MRRRVFAPVDSEELVPPGSPAGTYNLDTLRAAAERRRRSVPVGVGGIPSHQIGFTGGDRLYEPQPMRN